MEHNILLDPLPESVCIDGKEYPINFGYRAGILIEIDMFSDRDDEQKVLDALNIFYLGNIPGNKDAAMERLLWFYRCGKEGTGQQANGGRRRAGKRAYCFDTDAGRIYAAFRTQYRINLNMTPNRSIHWWEFMAMFESLSEDLLISRIMFYRTTDMDGMGKKQKEFIRKMKGIYGIKHNNGSLEGQAKLAKRNTDMKEYVRKRMEECGKR